MPPKKPVINPDITSSLDNVEMPVTSGDTIAAKDVKLSKSKKDAIALLYNRLKNERSEEEAKYEYYEAAYKDSPLNDESLSDRFPDFDEDVLEHFTIVCNLVRSTVEQKRAMIGIVPNIHCPPKDYSPQSVQLAQKREKAILSIWDSSYIGQLMGDLAYYLAIYGTAVGVVYADTKARRPHMTVRSPKGFYCLARDEDGIELSTAIFYEKYWGPAADARWPGKGFDKLEDVEVLEYWDDKLHCIMTIDGDKVMLSHENALGFVPVVSIPNIGEPKKCYGLSDVDAIYELQQEFNRRFAKEAEIVDKVIDAPYVVVNPEQAPEELAVKPGGIIPVGLGGDVRQLNQFNLPYSWEQSFARVVSMFDRQADAPEIMRGNLDSSVITGKGVDELMGPMAGRIELRHNYVFPRLEWMNWMSLYMWDLFWPNEPHDIDGRKAILGGNAFFSDQIQPGEFQGDYRNKVFMNSYAYLDQNAQVVLGLQLVQNQIISKASFRQQLNFIDNPALEAEQVKNEALENAMLAGMARQAQQAPGMAQPPLGAQGMTNYQLEQGYMGQTPPAPVPGGLPPSAPPGAGNGPPEAAMGESEGMAEPGMEEMPPEMMAETEEGPQGGAEQANETLIMFADFIRSVKSIKGRVFLVGAILRGQEDLDAIGVIEMYVTSGVDKQTILNAIKNVAPELHGSIEFHTGVPSGQFLEVTPGTTGYDIQGSDNIGKSETSMGGPSGAGGNAPIGGETGELPL